MNRFIPNAPARPKKKFFANSPLDRIQDEINKTKKALEEHKVVFKEGESPAGVIKQHEPIWITSAGQKIPCSQISSPHLKNIITMLRRGRDNVGNVVTHLRHLLPPLIFEWNNRILDACGCDRGGQDDACDECSSKLF